MDSGLIAPRVDESGNITSSRRYGVQAEIGAYGAKAWRRTSFGLDYRGDYRKYTRSVAGFRGFDGTNQAISADVTHRLTRRTMIFGRQTGGTTNRAFGAFAAPTFSDDLNFGIPLDEVFDTRMYYSQTQGGLGYSTSARTQVMVQGSAFFVKRVNRALIGMQGWQSGASVAHRLNASDRVTVFYNRTNFTFPRIYGGSDADMVGIRYGKTLNERWSLSFSGGVFDVRTFGTQRVELSPEVALILGRPTGVEAFNRRVRAPQGSATVSYSLERSRLTAGYTRGIGAGNGIYITTQQESYTVGYSYAGFRRLSLGASAGYRRASSVGLDLRDFSSFHAGGGLNYRMTDYVSFSTQMDRREFSAPGIQGRSGSSVTVGIAVSPVRLPLAIW